MFLTREVNQAKCSKKVNKIKEGWKKNRYKPGEKWLEARSLSDL